MVTKIVSEDDAFRTFAVDPPYAARTIKKKLSEGMTRRIEQLVSAQDWPDYKYRTGFIRGLQEAIEICEEMETSDRR